VCFVFDHLIDEEVVGQNHRQNHLILVLLVGVLEFLVDGEEGEVGGEGGRGEEVTGAELEFFANVLQELGESGAVFEHEDELLLREACYFEFVVFGLQECVLQSEN
jgi:hypothetical protein